MFWHHWTRATSLWKLELASPLMEAIQQAVDSGLRQAQPLANDSNRGFRLTEVLERMVPAEHDKSPKMLVNLLPLKLDSSKPQWRCSYFLVLLLLHLTFGLTLLRLEERDQCITIESLAAKEFTVRSVLVIFLVFEHICRKWSLISKFDYNFWLLSETYLEFCNQFKLSNMTLTQAQA